MKQYKFKLFIYKLFCDFIKAKRIYPFQFKQKVILYFKINTVEREGISITHSSKFILIGSGNPEEGELRPQLLDRFGMHAEIKTIKDPELRVKIIEQREMFE